MAAAKSTGMTRSEFNKSRAKHGHALKAHDNATYTAWSSMKQRCRRPYEKNYAGRGISVCERWQSFENFLADMGERPEGMSLDRYPNNDGDYSPDNCRWATPEQQARNKRNTRWLTCNGVTRSVADWADLVGVPSRRILNRLKYGWSVKDALHTPCRPYGVKARLHAPGT